MVVRIIDIAELQQYAVKALGLDPSACDLTTAEAISGALRRAAGFLCPCPKKSLLQAVLKSLQGIAHDDGNLSDTVEDILEALVAYGDLLEEREVLNSNRENRNTLLYAAPPSFIWRQNRSAFLLGIVPDHLSALPQDLQRRIESVNHVRCIQEKDGEDLHHFLKQLGLVELSADRWMKAPQSESSEACLSRLNNSLSEISGELPGLTILNPTRSVRYYRGRWETVSNQSGRFVAKRSQIYGNDLWCYVELENGKPKKMTEFPTMGSRLHGCDEAWRLQAAIDVSRNSPQVFRLRSGAHHNKKVVDFFSPVPMWARRRWDAVGEPSLNVGCLFSYQFLASDVEEEISFIKRVLWLAPAGKDEK